MPATAPLSATRPAGAPRVLAIIVNWNKREHVRRLLGELGALRRPPDEILVVDNASTDGSAEMIAAEFPHVTLLRSPQNVGGSGGFNRGLRWALERGGFDYLWLLDNDVVVHEGALEALLATAEADPAVGLVGSRIVDLGHPEKTQEVGATIFWPTCTLVKTGENATFARPGTQPAQVFPADYVASCSLLARTRAVEEVGIWDEGYFVFFDDIEWGIRFNRAGWKVVATTGSVIEHENFYERRLTQSVATKSLCTRNALHFMHGFAPPRIRPLLLTRVFTFLLHEVVQEWLDGRPEAARGHLVAIGDFFRSVRGPNRHVFHERPLVLTPADPAALAAVPRRKGRILFWTISGSEQTRRALARFRAQFPDHTVDVFVPAEVGELDLFQDERLIRRSTETRRERWRTARWALATYDATAHAERHRRYLFECLFPVSLWFNEAGEVRLTRNRPLRTLAAVLAKPLIHVGGACLGLAALLKPRARVDYFTWTKPGSERNTSAA